MRADLPRGMGFVSSPMTKPTWRRRAVRRYYTIPYHHHLLSRTTLRGYKFTTSSAEPELECPKIGSYDEHISPRKGGMTGLNGSGAFRLWFSRAQVRFPSLALTEI